MDSLTKRLILHVCRSPSARTPKTKISDLASCRTAYALNARGRPEQDVTDSTAIAPVTIQSAECSCAGLRMRDGNLPGALFADIERRLCRGLVTL